MLEVILMRTTTDDEDPEAVGTLSITPAAPGIRPQDRGNVCDYDVVLHAHRGFSRTGQVLGFDETKGPWVLVTEALTALGVQDGSLPLSRPPVGSTHPVFGGKRQ